jgi:hypothetical protein
MSSTRSVRAVASLSAGLLLGLGLMGCSDPEASAEVVATAPTTEQAEGSSRLGQSTSTTTATGGSPTTTDPAATTTTTGAGPQGRLDEVLLTVDDLASGHVQAGPDVTRAGTATGGEALCTGGEPGSQPLPQEQVQRTFVAQDSSSTVVSFAARYADAAAWTAFLGSELDRCGGHADAFEYEARDLPGIGDEAFVVTYTAPGAIGPGVLTYARVGDVVVGVTVFAEPGVSMDVTDLLLVSAGRA